MWTGPKPQPTAGMASSGEQQTPAQKIFSAIPEINPPARELPRVPAGLHIKGEITGSEDLRFDGTMKGSVSLDGARFTAGPGARIQGDVTAREIVVYGSIEGDLRAQRIEIKKDGSVLGDLTTARIMIEDGAYFKGSVEIERAEKKKGATAPSAEPALVGMLAQGSPADD